MQKVTLFITGIAALAFAGASFAQQPVQADKTKAATDVITTTPKDTTKFCYYADQAYSEGSERDGATCQRLNTTSVFSRAGLPLSWVRAPQIRSIQPKLSDEN